MFDWFKNKKEDPTDIESKLIALIKANGGTAKDTEDGSIKFENLTDLSDNVLTIREDYEIDLYYDLLISPTDLESCLLELVKANISPIEDLPDGSIKFSNLKDVNGDVLVIKKDIQIKFYSKAYSGKVN